MNVVDFVLKRGCVHLSVFPFLNIFSLNKVQRKKKGKMESPTKYSMKEKFHSSPKHKTVISPQFMVTRSPLKSSPNPTSPSKGLAGIPYKRAVYEKVFQTICGENQKKSSTKKIWRQKNLIIKKCSRYKEGHWFGDFGEAQGESEGE